MTSAPTPGIGRRKEAVEAAQLMCTITYDDTTLTFAYNDVPLGDKRDCKVQTGASLERWMDDVSDVTLCVLWWLARRRNGEPRLHYQAAELEFDGELLGAVDFGAVEGDSPEV